MLKLFYYFLDSFPRLFWNISYRILRNKYDIHPSFRFNGRFIEMYGLGRIKIEKNSYIGSFSTLQADHGCILRIGEGCMISHNVRIYTSTASPDQDLSQRPHVTKYGNVEIGNYVWIGANTFINPGVRIGDNSVVGANSVVTKDIKENTIVGGVPAKLIRTKLEK